MKLKSKRLIEKRGWMLKDLKDKKIVRVQDKCDGSIISFVKFSNGKVRAKSKMSFESDQAVLAQKVYDDNKNIQNFVYECFKDNRVPIFELVSPENQIVLEYDSTELILLQIRNDDGKYLDRGAFFGLASTFNIKTAEEYDDKFKDLDYLLHLKETSDEDIEGWVITFEDGQMAKIKLDKYLELHGLIGPDAFRENLLVQSIINGSIDDVIAALVPGPKKDSIVELEEKVSHKFNSLVQDFIELRAKYFDECEADRKTFAIKYSKNSMFGAVIRTVQNDTSEVEKIAEKAVKEYILKVTKSLGDAKKWVETI